MYLVCNINPPNNQSCFPEFFPQIFLSLAVEKASKKFFGWFKTGFFSVKSLFSFSTAQTQKNSWKKLGKTKLVVWCHEQDIDH